MQASFVRFGAKNSMINFTEVSSVRPYNEIIEIRIYPKNFGDDSMKNDEH